MKRRLLFIGSLSLALLFLALTLGWGHAQAPEAAMARPQQVINVTTTTVNFADNGACSLIEAIVNANADAAVSPDCPAGSGADLIVLAPGATYTATGVHTILDGPNALPPITSTLVISGNGAIIERSTEGGILDFRLIHVGETGVATLDHLTLRGGMESAVVGDDANGGAIYNRGVLTVNDSVISGNLVSWAGGGIFNRGALTLTRTIVLNNASGWQGGGINNQDGAVALLDSEVLSNTAGVWAGGGIYNVASAVTQTATLRLDNTVVAGNSAGQYGGGLANEDGAMTLDRSTVRGNIAGNVGGGIDTRATARDATTEVNDSLIAENEADGGGGGIAQFSAAGLTARLTVNRSAVRANKATGATVLQGFGGGIFNGLAALQGEPASIVALNDSLVSGNQATNGGGIGNGILQPVAAVRAVVTLNNSTVSDNVARLSNTSEQTGNGGGIFNANGAVTLINSTISGNRAEGDPGRGSGMGGGIANAAFDLPTTIMLTHSTVAGNTAGRGGGIANAYLAQVAGAGPAEIVFRDSLVAGNQDGAGNPSCWNDAGSAGAEAVKLTSQGYNLEDRAACNFDQATDQPAADPLLGPLGDNGGPTPTHALPFGSPAVDAIPAAACAAPRDQRGVSRPQGPGCDIGAYEAQLPVVRLMKAVAAGGDPAQVRLGGIVTYTLVLSNAGAATATGVALTDTLPAGVAFGGWLAQDSARLAPPDTIGWGPADILADTSITISFTVAVTGSQAFAGQTITNTAGFSTVDAGHGSSQAAFSVQHLSLIYLPLVVK